MVDIHVVVNLNRDVNQWMAHSSAQLVGSWANLVLWVGGVTKKTPIQAKPVPILSDNDKAAFRETSLLGG